MVPRRIAWLSVLAFLFGPAANAQCLIACAPNAVAATRSECHGAGHPNHPSLGGNLTCGDTGVHVTPFVKSSGGPVLGLAVPPSDIVPDIDRALARPRAVPLSDTGPPGSRTALPLRI